MSVDLLLKAMKSVHDASAIDLKGKKYTQVNVRVKEFRAVFGLEYGIETTIDVGSKGAITTAHIKRPDGFIVGSGHSYTNDFTNAFKGLEKAETTAIGRALASIGLGGDEYASIDEIDSVGDRLLQEDIKQVSLKDTPKNPAEMLAYTGRLIDVIKMTKSTEDIDKTLNAYSGKVSKFPEYMQNDINQAIVDQKEKLKGN